MISFMTGIVQLLAREQEARTRERIDLLKRAGGDFIEVDYEVLPNRRAHSENAHNMRTRSPDVREADG